MLASTSSPQAGSWLRVQRERLHLSVRKVQELSLAIAREKGDMQFCVSRSWITDIESGKFKPSVQKLYSLSIIYQCDWNEVIARFEIFLPDLTQGQGHVQLPHTHLLKRSAVNIPTLEVPTGLRNKIQFEKTNLIARMFENWAEIPVPFLENMDLRHSLYGYIGKEDFTLFPVIRPSAIVQIDPRQNRITTELWQYEHDRPIYFFELRDRYVCCWAELNGSNLILIPSSQSKQTARHLRYPGDVDILGRVTGISMPLAETTPIKSSGKGLDCTLK